MSKAEINMYQNELNIDIQQYQKIFYESPTGMLLLDREANILKANQAITKMSGYELEELIGSNIFGLFVLEDQEQINQEKYR